MRLTNLRDENGFTLIELLVASALTVIVLGGAVALTSQIQNGYRRELEDSAGEQEGRYALDFINRYLRSVGNNPFNITSSNCPGTNTLFYGLIVDPNGDGVNDDIRLQSDSNPPDKQIGGPAGNCTQKNEQVLISYSDTDHAITFTDEGTGGTAVTRTDAVIDGLEFVYLDSNHAVMTSPINQANVFYVQTNITIRTRTIDVSTGSPITRMLSSEVRVRSR